MFEGQARCGLDSIELQGEIAFLIAVVGVAEVEDVPLVPLPVELLLYQFDYLLLLGLDACLLLSEPI